MSIDPQTVAAGSDAVDAVLAAAGDTRAFERLYRGHVARIHALARRMAGEDEAEELTQMIFVRAWQKLGTFRGEAKFATWLHRVGINVILCTARACCCAVTSSAEERTLESDVERAAGAQDPWTKRLSEYLDGVLKAADHPPVAGHTGAIDTTDARP